MTAASSRSLQEEPTFDQFAKDANKPLELQPTYVGAAPDSDATRQPPLPETPYRPFTPRESSLNETPYEPYAKRLCSMNLLMTVTKTFSRVTKDRRGERTPTEQRQNR
jgi:hypothetical protein